MQRNDLIQYLDNLLLKPGIQDYCPNGLQVEGKAEIETIVTGVTASSALLEAAIRHKADLVLVHHGYFWRGENPCIVGMKRERLRKLLAANMNLVAYHLPLDMHPVYGNNAQLGALLGFQSTGSLPGEPLVCTGVLDAPQTAAELGARIQLALGRRPLVISESTRPIGKVAWCSGGAQGYIEQVAQAGFDAYISGEISEPTVHIAREYGMHYFAAGHHATERYGIQALGEHLAQTHGLTNIFVDIENPV